MQNLERMRELIQTINEADEAYYKYDAPIMADLDYDRLYDELVALERETGTILSSSPTQRVSGEVLESLTAVRHTRPMLSADKCKSVADIHKYLGGPGDYPGRWPAGRGCHPHGAHYEKCPACHSL